MKFARRLKLYLIGVLMGCVLVVFFFNDRLSVLTSWLTNNRVLLRLEMTTNEISASADCMMKCAQLDTTHLEELYRDGDVNFELSQTRQDPKIYVVDIRLKDRLSRFEFAAADSTARLQNVIFPNGDLSCDCP